MPELRGILWGAAGAGVAVALVTGVALASRAEIGVPAPASELRLALRAAHARLEICSERSDDELAELPAHFRVRRECEEVAVDYRLTLVMDGVSRIDRRVSHRGVRRTRPLAVDEAIPVAAGRHRVELVFVPEPPPEMDSDDVEGEEDDADDGEGEDESARLRAAFAALAAPRFAAEIDFRAGRAELLVLDEKGAFRLAGGVPPD
jgi:hypothetical protein